MRLLRSRVLSACFALVLLVGLLAAFPASVGAATFVVTTTDDSGPGSLRQAILSAEASPGPDVITFNLSYPATIAILSTLPDISTAIDIQGPGPADLVIEGNNTFRAFDVAAGGNLTLSGVDIAASGIVNSGVLVIENVILRDRTAVGSGAGIESYGPVTIRSSTFSNNGATVGAGVNSQGALTVVNSTFSGNSATLGGGIFAVESGTKTVVNSTFSGNGATLGGAIYVGEQMSVTHLTISGNNATNGGGVHVGEGASFTMAASIVTGNTGTIGDDISGPIVDGGYNLLGDLEDNTGIADGVNGNIVGGNADLQALAGNGGPTETRALGGASEALDHIPASECAVNTDQRGVIRPQNGACDIGAYEQFTDTNNLQACLFAGSLSRVSNIGDDTAPSPSLNCGRGAALVLAGGKDPSSDSFDDDLYACLYAGSLSQVGRDAPASCGRGTLVAIAFNKGLNACLFAGQLSQVSEDVALKCGRGIVVALARADFVS